MPRFIVDVGGGDLHSLSTLVCVLYVRVYKWIEMIFDGLESE